MTTIDRVESATTTGRFGVAAEIAQALARFVGREEVARVWRIYLVGGAMAFRDGRMGVDQILAVRPDHGASDLEPVRPGSWS